MEKIINILIKVFCWAIYLPVFIIIFFARATAVARVTVKNVRLVRLHKFDLPEIISLQLEAKLMGEVQSIGDYTIYIVPDTSLLQVGFVFIYKPTKSILVGWEMADEFLSGSALAQSIIGHEQGHVESPDGDSTKRTWWNPEDWIERGPTHTPAEVAADLWALEHGADGEAMVSFLKKVAKFRPISAYIRIHHIRRYMNKKSE